VAALGTVVCWTNGSPVVEADVKGGVFVPVAVAAGRPRAPVHCAPCGQQATARFWSAVQMAVRGQQRPGALRAAQA
jgi:hypothetical protein